MAALLSISCHYDAPEGWQWAANINKEFRHPMAVIDVTETPLNWDRPIVVEVAPGEAHRLQVFMRILGLHWCGAEMEVGPLVDGESASMEYHLDSTDRWMNRGHLTPR